MSCITIEGWNTNAKRNCCAQRLVMLWDLNYEIEVSSTAL